MPYLEPADQRPAVRDYPIDAGELTYAIQQTINSYLLRNGLRYAHIAEVLGALEGAKADFIRRVVDPYEARKQADNGDVWTESLVQS